MKSRLLAASAAALPLLVLPSTALAAPLEGGARYAGTTSKDTPIKLRLNGAGDRIKRMRVDYPVNCDNGGRGETYTIITNVRLRGARNKYSAKGTYTGTDDGSKNRFEVAGRIGKRAARGTFRLTATVDDTDTGETISCRSGAVRFRAPAS